MISTVDTSLAPAASETVKANACDDPCPDAGLRDTTVGAVGMVQVPSLAKPPAGPCPAEFTAVPYTFFVTLVPSLAKAALNWRLTVMVSTLPDVLMEDPLPLSVHCEFETVAACPGVTEPTYAVPALLVK